MIFPDQAIIKYKQWRIYDCFLRMYIMVLMSSPMDEKKNPCMQVQI